VRIEPFPITETIAQKITLLNADNIITIVRNDPAYYRTEFAIDDPYYVNGFLSELYCYSEIESLPEVPIPNYETVDSETTKLNKTLQIVWGGPRFHLCTWISKSLNPTPDTWILTGMTSLLNSQGYPYRRDRPLDLLTDNLAREFGQNTCIGVSIRNVGHGLPDARDVINIDGAWKRDCRIVRPDFIPVLVSGGTVQNVTQFQRTRDLSIAAVNATKKTTALAPTAGRITASVQNTHVSATLYYAERDITPTSTDNDGTIAPGATRAVRSGYSGAVSVSATGAATLTINELYNQ
jgi:hypothetical protein